ERLGFPRENSVGAGGIVKCVAVVGAKRDGSLQMSVAFLRFAEIGQVGGQKDAGSYIFGNHFQLFSQDNVHALADMLRFLLSSQPLQAHTEGNVRVVVVARGLERLLIELGGCSRPSVSETSPSG